MTAPEDDDDRVEFQLLETLRRLEKSLGEVDAESMPIQPESLIESIQDQTTRLDELVKATLSSIEQPSDVPSNSAPWSMPMADVVRSEFETVLGTLKFPLVCRTSFGSAGLRGLDMTQPERIRAAIRRGLTMAGTYAGPGGEIDVSTLEIGGRAALIAVARRPGEDRGSMSEAEEPGITMRSRSLTEFVSDLGGNVEVDIDEDGRLRVSLEFAFVAS